MASRKVKHARALAKREEFMKTVHQGNQDWLKSEQSRRISEREKAEAARKDRAIAKSKKLAKENKHKKQGIDEHHPVPIKTLLLLGSLLESIDKRRTLHEEEQTG